MAVAKPMEQGEQSKSTGFGAFWTNWSIPKGILFSWLALWGFGTPFYDSMGVEAPDWWEPLAAVVMFLCVWAWLFNDSRRFRAVASNYGGFALYVFWPLLLPVYLVQSRGWRRASAAFLLAVLVWFASIVVGAILGAVVSVL